MQKKSLLVALFFGALCLTGCLKNEESASVEQVRLAKAEELKASAALKNAKAQAEVIYANAEATLKQAQAALLNAQAETEKVRAELLKVRVKLAEVLVEEEKVELLKKQAELEVLLAQYEAEKQDWINQLNNLLAQAEIDALQNAHDVLDAIAAFEEANMDDAQYYAYRYYDALQQVQALELQQLAIKAEKAMVQAGVKAAKKSLNFELEQIDKQIAENEEMIAALQARQYMTAEEAEAALKEARIALSEAYSDYQDVLLAENAAWEAYNAIDSKKALFLAGWNEAPTPTSTEDPGGFVYFVNNNPANPKWSAVGPKGFIDYEDYSAVTYYGYTNEKKEFVKLWKKDQEKYNHVLYPTVEEESVRSDFFGYDAMQIAPAEIFYENIEAYADAVVAQKQAEIDKNVKDLNTASAANVAAWNAAIEANKEALALSQEYIDARKAAVTKAEGELETAVKEYNSSSEGHASALKEYQEYMVVNYDISRTYFENVFKAEGDTVTTSKALVAAQAAFDAKKATISTLEAEQKQAVKDEATAQGKYTVAKKTYDEGGTAGKLTTAEAAWNPKFDGKDKTKNAGTSQIAWLNAQDAEATALATWEEKQLDLARDPENETKKAAEKTAHTNYNNAVLATGDAKAEMDAAETKYNTAKSVDDAAKKELNKAAEAWNEEKEKDAKGKETGNIGTGTTQVALRAANKALADAKEQIEKDSYVDAEGKTQKTLKKVLDDAKADHKAKVSAYETEFNTLLAQLDVKKKDYKEDAKVRELYEKASASSKAWSTVTKKFGALTALYNKVAPDTPYLADGKTPMGWFVCNYNVDYTYEFISEVKDDATKGAVIVKKTAAEQLHGKIDDGKGKLVPDVTKSLAYKDAVNAAKVAAEPAVLAGKVAKEQAKINDIKTKVANLKAELAVYKGYEAEYNTWVDERMEAYEDWTVATVVSHEAWHDYIAAKAVYTALEDIAQQKVYVYDPENDDANPEGFVELTISEEIERLQGTSAVLNECVAGLIEAAAISVDFSGDLTITTANISAIVGVLQDYAEEYGTSIVGLNVVKKLLEKVLEKGDVIEEIVLEMLDERLQWNEEQIEILNAVAAKFQSLMYMYLGVDAVDVLGAEEE